MGLSQCAPNAPRATARKQSAAAIRINAIIFFAIYKGISLQRGSYFHPAFAFRVERVVNNKLTPKSPKPACDPAQTFASGVRIGGTRISRADDLPQKHERWFSQIVFLKGGIEGDILAVMSQLTVRNIEAGPVIDFFPLGLTEEKYKLRLRIDKIPDQPRTSHAIDFNFFARDPFHARTLVGHGWSGKHAEKT